MIERVWFKPKPGVHVPLEPGRSPASVGFPPEGKWTVRDRYIERRLREGAGDIIDMTTLEPVKVETKAREPLAPMPISPPASTAPPVRVRGRRR